MAEIWWSKATRDDMKAADGGVFNFGDAPQLAPYEPLINEYARGDRRAVGATTASGGDRLLVLADDGAQYELGRA
jgi:hypothetical protein